jgi:hypothetical protein
MFIIGSIVVIAIIIRSSTSMMNNNSSSSSSATSSIGTGISTGAVKKAAYAAASRSAGCSLLR